MSAKLMEYFNKQPRLSVLSTSSKNGIVDVAVMGSPQMVDEKTIITAFALVSSQDNIVVKFI
jgi:hypothetical protein